MYYLLLPSSALKFLSLQVLQLVFKKVASEKLAEFIGPPPIKIESFQFPQLLLLTSHTLSLDFIFVSIKFKSERGYLLARQKLPVG